MDRTRLQIAPGIALDARRAVWLEATRTLLVADLHLGYAWAHRQAGHLLPLSAREDTTERLLELATDYQAREVVLLGDIVHRAVRVAALQAELRELFGALRARVTVTAVAGNHDQGLSLLLRESQLDVGLVREHWAGPHRLIHGDDGPEPAVPSRTEASGPAEGRVFLGHEHPAITLSDRVAHHAKCPCFLIAPGVIVLPAFSPWAAGSNVRHGQFMSGWANGADFGQAVAILAGKLLSIPLGTGAGRRD